MLFFLPFVAEPVAKPASARMLQCTQLPLLPAPRSARAARQPDGLAGAIEEAGNAGADLLKRTLAAMTSSMTALGNHASALFGQVAAALAYQRMARQTASLFGMFWPGLAHGAPRNGFAGAWTTPAPWPPLAACFGLPGFDAGPLAPNPLDAFAQAIDMWAGFFAPASPQRRNSYGAAPAPLNATFAFPGFSWTITLASVR
jgi:hypothetical protein